MQKFKKIGNSMYILVDAKEIAIIERETKKQVKDISFDKIIKSGGKGIEIKFVD